MREKLREYVDEMIYGANDGIITTFAVVAGAAGASLPASTIIILGFANLFADGFSMGASSFLSYVTERDVQAAAGKASGRSTPPFKSSLATFAAFVLAGLLPLIPFVCTFIEGHVFLRSAAIAGVAFFVIGGLRSLVTKKSFFTSGLQMLTIGGTAAAIAYGVGYFIESIVA